MHRTLDSFFRAHRCPPPHDQVRDPQRPGIRRWNQGNEPGCNRVNTNALNLYPPCSMYLTISQVITHGRGILPSPTLTLSNPLSVPGVREALRCLFPVNPATGASLTSLEVRFPCSAADSPLMTSSPSLSLCNEVSSSGAVSETPPSPWISSTNESRDWRITDNRPAISLGLPCL
jgi:hypothetical protein